MLQKPGIHLALLVDRRSFLATQKQELGAEQTHAFGPEVDRRGRVVRASEVREKRDRGSVSKNAVDDR